MTLTKKLAATAMALAVSSTCAASVITFNNTSLGGTVNFQFDEIVVTSAGPSTIILTDGGAGAPNGILDVDANGLIGGLVTTDTFTETGRIEHVSFRLNNLAVGPATTLLGVQYQLFIVYEPPSDGLSGLAAVDALGNAIAVFTAPTTATMFYDTDTVDPAFNAGTSTAVGELTLDPSFLSNCSLPQLGAAQGTCVVNALFDDAGTTGVWTIGGTDIASLGATSRLDFNVDETVPPFSPVFGAIGGTQVVSITHDGSQTFQVVPEPGSVALLGLGLFGLAALRRRKM